MALTIEPVQTYPAHPSSNSMESSRNIVAALSSRRDNLKTGKSKQEATGKKP